MATAPAASFHSERQLGGWILGDLFNASEQFFIPTPASAGGPAPADRAARRRCHGDRHYYTRAIDRNVPGAGGMAGGSSEVISVGIAVSKREQLRTICGHDHLA